MYLLYIYSSCIQMAVFPLKSAIFLYIAYFSASIARFRNGSAVPQSIAL